MTRTHRITLIPGDGIGPEVTNAVVPILEHAGRANGCTFRLAFPQRGRRSLRPDRRIYPEGAV